MITPIAAVIANFWLIPMIPQAANMAIFSDLIRAGVFAVMSVEGAFWGGLYWGKKHLIPAAVGVFTMVFGLCLAVFYAWSGAVDIFVLTLDP